MSTSLTDSRENPVQSVSCAGQAKRQTSVFSGSNIYFLSLFVQHLYLGHAGVVKGKNWLTQQMNISP